MDDEVLERRSVTVVAAPTILGSLGITTGQSEEGAKYAGPPPARAFDNPEAEKVAQLAYEAIRKLSRSPGTVPDISYISRPEVQAQLVREVQSQYRPQQMELEGVAPPAPDFATVIAKTAALVVDRTINIPRISVSPKGEIKAGFRPFTLDLSSMTYVAPDETLWAQYLGRNEGHSIGMSQGNFLENRPEDYVVGGLIDFPDVSYDDNADLLYDLGGQVVQHFHSYLSAEDTLRLPPSFRTRMSRTKICDATFGTMRRSQRCSHCCNGWQERRPSSKDSHDGAIRRSALYAWPKRFISSEPPRGMPDGPNSEPSRRCRGRPTGP
ncbi:hypothetical protein [Sphingobium yanoikuyae]|uniref:hypothetical protein n=1 Tax=Sphingobium yanoikuyae TaxID=13690 RepID=UPI00131EF32B|nr:hypothetical protein [Sphingobium yanoikuyae]